MTAITNNKKTVLTLAYVFIVLIAAMFWAVLPKADALSLVANNQLDLILVLSIIALGVGASYVGAFRPIVFGGAAVGIFIVLSTPHEQLVRYLTLSGVLFAIGMYGMVRSRNAVRVLMSIELMLNAVNINLIAFARYIDPAQIKGQLFAIFTLTVAAAEAAVGLAIVLQIYRSLSTVDMNRFNLLKW